VNFEKTESDASLRYIEVLRRFRWLLVISTLVFILGAVGVDANRTKMYTAQAQLQLVSQNLGSNGTKVPLSGTDIATAIQVAGSKVIAAEASSSLGSQIPSVSVRAIGLSAVIQFIATSQYPEVAARTVNLFANAYISYTGKQFRSQVLAQEDTLSRQRDAAQELISKLELKLQTTTTAPSASGSHLSVAQLELQNAASELQNIENSLSTLALSLEQSPSGGILTGPASPPTTPTSPKPLRDIPLAGLMGLLFGFSIAIGLDSRDDHIRTSDQLQKSFESVPVLGEIPKFDKWTDEDRFKIIFNHRPDSLPSEAYRSLRTTLQFLGMDAGQGKMVQITSPNSNEGKSTTSVNLAVSLADDGKKVVLVSGDLRRPQIHKYFNLENDEGLSDVLSGAASLTSVLRVSEVNPRLNTINSGPIPPNPSELLGSERSGQILNELKKQFDFVIIDTPPILPVTDALVISRYADAIIFIVNSRDSRSRDIKESLDRIKSVSSRVDGFVLNSTELPTSRYRYGYRYGYKKTDYLTAYGDTPERVNWRKIPKGIWNSLKSS